MPWAAFRNAKGMSVVIWGCILGCLEGVRRYKGALIGILEVFPLAYH